MYTRRRFIEILPLASLPAFVACGEKAAPSTATPTPAAAPALPSAPSPAPAPAVTAAPAAPPATPVPAATAAGPMVDPADSAAAALGYVSNAATTKDAKHTQGAACANCALFGGKAGDASGPCPLYPGKQVAAIGWCTAYAKKG